jgi:hypothetical protein
MLSLGSGAVGAPAGLLPTIRAARLSPTETPWSSRAEPGTGACGRAPFGIKIFRPNGAGRVCRSPRIAAG